METPKRFFLILILSIVFAFSVFQLANYVIKFGNESLQMDFSAYYTAGEALNHGLSPYVNHLSRDPAIWDGVDTFKHSRFTYTPSAAIAFQPIALLPYKVAKYLWMLIIIACVAISMAVMAKITGVKLSAENSLIMGIAVSTFFPFLAALERGQIDAVNLMLLILAVNCMLKKDDRMKLAAGVLMAVATLFKLYCVFIIPFLLLRRKWKVLMGYIIGMAVLLSITFIMTDGIFFDYWQKALPRISQYSEEGTDEMLMPPEVLSSYMTRTRTPPDFTVKDGVFYRSSSLELRNNISSLVVAILRNIETRPFYRILDNTMFGKHITSTVAFIVLAALAAIMGFLQLRYFKNTPQLKPEQEAVYWQMAIIAILLAGARSWVMNAVWLTTAIVLVMHVCTLLSDRRQVLPLCACIVGLIAIWSTDEIFSSLIPFSAELVWYKYVLGELIVFISLGVILKNMIRQGGVLSKDGNADAPNSNRIRAHCPHNDIRQ